MIPQKGRRLLFFFLAIYALFGGILIYLFLFNSGLEIAERFNEEESTKEVFVVNTTSRLINNVSVKYQIGDALPADLNVFESLGPGEEQRLFLDGIVSSQITLIIESPFHLTIEKLIVLKVKNKVDITVNFPSDVLFGKSFGFFLEACNNTSNDEKVKVEESHEIGFFSEPNKIDSITVPPQVCKRISYSLIPIRKGDTVIYFNISTTNNIEEFEQPVKVK